jgi:hypothetical protein
MKYYINNFEIFSELTNILTNTASKISPTFIENKLDRKYNNAYLLDEQTKIWITERANYRRRIEQTKSNKKVKALRKKRSLVSKHITKRLKHLRNERIKEIAEELEKNRGNKKCFEALKLLKTHEYIPFELTDEEGHTITNPKRILPIITKYYKEFFTNVDIGIR